MDRNEEQLGIMMRIGLRLGILEPSLHGVAELWQQKPIFPEFRMLKNAPASWLDEHISAQDQPEIYALGLFLHWFPELRQAYARQNLPETVFWDSVQDLGIWCRDREQKTGLQGLSEWDWVGKTFRMEVFRIGRLQYEPRVLETEIALEGMTVPPGTELLEIHIPAEAPLRRELVLNSLTEAPGFFEKYFGKTLRLGHCHSWLLARELSDLLPETSGILGFQRCFRLYGETYDFPQAEQRVFGLISGDPRDYPAETSLQKNLKAWLLEGKAVGMGKGILDFRNFSPDRMN